jgi:hypothetical protein
MLLSLSIAIGLLGGVLEAVVMTVGTPQTAPTSKRREKR